MSSPENLGTAAVSPPLNLEALRNRAIEQLDAILPSPLAQKRTFSFAELDEKKDEEQKFIIPELLPAYAVAVLIGEDGIGKTQLLNQLCLHIAFKYESFLGMKLHFEHGRALIVATEDSRQKWIKAITKQAYTLEPRLKPQDVQIYFTEGSIFDEFIYLKEEIENFLKANPTDIIIVDALSDLFTLIDGEINSNSHARKLLSFFQLLCDTYQTTIIIIHHAAKSKIVVKHRENKLFVEKGDSQGAGAITQKPRTVLALSNDPKSISPDGSSYTNYLHVVKANLMSKLYNQNAIQLEFNTKSLLHKATGLTDIVMMQQAQAQLPVQAPEAEGLKRKAHPSEIPDAQHHETLGIIFREAANLSRGEVIDKMVAHYGVGRTKIESSLDKGGFLAYLLQEGFLIKTGNGFTYNGPQISPRAPEGRQKSFGLDDNVDEPFS